MHANSKKGNKWINFSVQRFYQKHNSKPPTFLRLYHHFYKLCHHKVLHWKCSRNLPKHGAKKAWFGLWWIGKVTYHLVHQNSAQNTFHHTSANWWMGKKKKFQSGTRRWCSTGWRPPPPPPRTPPPAPSPPSGVFLMGGKWLPVETDLFQNKVLLLFLKIHLHNFPYNICKLPFWMVLFLMWSHVLALRPT